MRIFITGATGAIGQRLVPQLKERGHQIVASVRSAAKADRLRALGVESVILDLLDPEAVRLAVSAATFSGVNSGVIRSTQARSLRPISLIRSESQSRCRFVPAPRNWICVWFPPRSPLSPTCSG